MMRWSKGGIRHGKVVFHINRMQSLFWQWLHEEGDEGKVKKEPENEYDAEAIMVKMKGIGKVGYVANSAYTVQGDTMSAGWLYDKIGKKAKAKIVYVIPGGAICKLIEDEVADCGGIELLVEEVDEVKFGSKHED